MTLYYFFYVVKKCSKDLIINVHLKDMARSSNSVIYLLMILVIIIFLMIFFNIGYFYINPDNDNTTFCTQEAKLCPDGGYVSRNATLNCEFDPCSNSSIGNNSTQEEMTFCNPRDRGGEFCTKIYQPVCGFFDPKKIQCIKYPCAQTYSNSCFACQNPNVSYWTSGECPN